MELLFLTFVFLILWAFCTTMSLLARRARDKQASEDSGVDSYLPVDELIARSGVSGAVYAGILTALFWYNVR